MNTDFINGKLGKDTKSLGLGFGSSVVDGLSYDGTYEVYDPFTDQHFNEYEAAQISAVWTCVTLISRSISQLPLNLYRKNKQTKGLELATMGEYAIEVLLENSGSPMSVPDFIKSMAWNMVMHGNAYALIRRDGLGTIKELAPILFRDVNLNYDYLPPYYGYRYNINGVGDVQEHQILHIKNVTSTGREGKSVLYNGQRAFAIAAALDKHQASFFGNGAFPRVVLESTAPMTDENKRKLLYAWNAQHQGVSNAHKAGILDGDVKAKPLSYKNQEAQMDETAERAVLNVCRYFQVPAHMANVLNSEPKANFTEAYLMYINNVIKPYLYNIEKEINRKFLSPKERRTFGYCFKFDSSKLVLGNALDRAKTLQIVNQSGGNILTQNEIREGAGFQPVEGGDVYVKGSMPPVNTGKEEDKENDFDFDNEKNRLVNNNRWSYGIK